METSQNSRVSFQLPKQKVTFFAWLICGLGALFYCYEYFLRIAPSVMSTELRQVYQLDAGGFGNLIAFYYYAYTPMQIIVGLFMDRYGPRLLVTLACLACAIGTYLFASSDVLVIAQAGRFLVGFGSAFAFVGALKLATIWLPPERFAMVSGLIVALGNVGAIAGDIAVTAIVEHVGWRQTSMYSAAFGIALAIIIVLIVRDNSGKVTHQHDKKHELTNSFKNVLHGLWAAMKSFQVWKNGLVGGLLYIPTTAFAELWAVPYLEQARGLTDHQAATTVSMIFLGWVVGCPLAGFISDFIKRRLLPMMVGAVLAIFISCYILYVPNISLSVLHVLFFLLGITGCAQVIVFAVGRESTPSHIAGTAIAFTNTFTMLSGVIFQPLVGHLLDLHWHGEMADGIRVYSAHNFQYALSIIPLGLIAALIILFFMRETRCELLENDSDKL